MKREIFKFDYEEIVFVLLMLVSNLVSHLKQGLKSFVEASQRLDTVSKHIFQIRFNWTMPRLDKGFISRMFELKIQYLSFTHHNGTKYFLWILQVSWRLMDFKGEINCTN